MLSSHLLSKGLVTSDQDCQLRNEMHPKSNWAAELVNFVLNRVELNSGSYRTFIECLEKNKECNRHILEIWMELMLAVSMNTIIDKVIYGSTLDRWNLGSFIPLQFNILFLRPNQPYFWRKCLVALSMCNRLRLHYWPRTHQIYSLLATWHKSSVSLCYASNTAGA